MSRPCPTLAASRAQLLGDGTLCARRPQAPRRGPRPLSDRGLRALAALGLAVLPLLVLGVGVGLAGCDDTATAEGPGTPRIVEVRPATAAPGAVIAVLGHHFGLQGPQDGLFLGGVSLAVESWNDDTVLARLPGGAGQPGGVLGTFDLVVRAGALVSQPFAFEVHAAHASLDGGQPDGALAEDVGPGIP